MAVADVTTDYPNKSAMVTRTNKRGCLENFCKFIQISRVGLLRFFEIQESRILRVLDVSWFFKESSFFRIENVIILVGVNRNHGATIMSDVLDVAVAIFEPEESSLSC